MKKLIAIVLMAAMLVACFASCGGNDSETASGTDSQTTTETLIVATNAEFEPFESLTADGELVGFDVDLMKAIGEKIGYEIKWQNMEFDGVVAAVTQGTCDAAISGLTINAKRKASVDFCDAYYSGAAQILIVASGDTYYTGSTKAELDEQLKNQTIGVCSGFTGQFYAQGDEDWGFTKIEGATVKIYENISLAIEDIRNGNISAVIMDDSVAKEAANANSDAVKVIDVPLTVEEYGIAVAKGNTELASKINTAYAELVASGKVAELLAKYGLE